RSPTRSRCPERGYSIGTRNGSIRNAIAASAGAATTASTASANGVRSQRSLSARPSTANTPSARNATRGSAISHRTAEDVEPTVADDGLPHLGLYPFAYDGHAIEIHLNSADAQFAHLEARPRCAFAVDEVLATVPSYWVDPDSAVAATAYHRTVLFECERAMIS